MNEFEIFVSACCGLTLVITWGYHRAFTLKRLQWKEDVYKLCAIRDEFLMLRIEGKIANDKVFDLIYDVINLGIAAGRQPKVRWFINALILSVRTTQPNQNELTEELSKNPELEALWWRYVDVLFIDIIMKRSVVLRWAQRIATGIRWSQVPAMIKFFKKVREKVKIFSNETKAYEAFKWFESLKAA